MASALLGCRVIPEEVWQKHFADKNGNYGGSRFEKLSVDILNEYFCSGWKPTKASHDGNKDFVLQCASERHWAESKAYRDPISYHVVSPTLFMAILGDAAKVIFLSRSAFKRTAKPLFAQYQRKTGRQILCFDGVTLDNMIARSPALTQKYFPGHQFTPLSREVHVTPSVSMDVTRPAPKTHDLADAVEDGNGELTIGLGEFIRVDVTLINETTAATEVKVALATHPPHQPGDWFDVVTFAEEADRREYTLTMAAGEVAQFAIMLRGAKPVARAELPALAVQVNGGEQETRRLGLATVSRLYRIGLTGKQHLTIRDAVLGAARHGRRHRVFQVVGRSGTGKSRLLQEISNALATEGYAVHRYDKEFEKPVNSDLILRALLADLNHLPLMPDDPMAEATADEVVEFTAVSDEQVLTRLIYDPAAMAKQDACLIGRALMRSTRAQKTAVIIDNVQNVDGTFADALDELVTLLCRDGNAPPALLVLAVNLDLEVEGSKTAQLRRSIATMARSDDASHPVRSYELKELVAEDVTQFIEDALHSPSGNFSLGDYPLTQRAFLEHVPHNPLHLWETLRYLRDSGTLRLDDDILVVQDTRDSQLAALLRDIPRDLADIMRCRWKELQAAAGRKKGGVSGEELVTAMRIASAIGAATRAQLAELGVDPTVLDHLVRVGLLRKAGFGQIAFFHQRVFHFFRSEFEDNFPAELALELVHRLRRSGADAALFQQFFVLLHLAHAVSLDDIRVTAEHLRRRGASPEFYRPYLAALLQDLINSHTPLEAWELETFERIGDSYQQLESLRAGADALNRSYSERVITVPPSALPGQAFADFAYRVVNTQLSIAEDHRALEVVEQAIAELPQTMFTDTEQRELSQAKLAYRKLSVVKNFGRADEALALGEDALKTARRLDDRWLEIETLMDSAEIFLSRGPGDQSRGEALSRYAEATRLFHGDFSLPDPVPVRSFVARAIIALCEGHWRDASEVCAEGILYALSIRNHFWLARLRLLRTRANLCLAATGLADLQAIVDEIKTTQDEMNVYAAGRDVWATFYLLGKTRMLAGNSTAAKTAFGEAIKAIASGGAKPERLARRHEVLYDIAVSVRALGLYGEDHMFDGLGTTMVRQECRSVLWADDAIFRAQMVAWREKVFLALDTPRGVLTLATP